MAEKRKPWAHAGKESRHKRGYGRQHAKLREQLLREEPLCRICRERGRKPPRVAIIADHIISIAKGGAIHDVANLQPLCLQHHQEKTLTEQGKRFKRRIGVDGWVIDH